MDPLIGKSLGSLPSKRSDQSRFDGITDGIRVPSNSRYQVKSLLGKQTGRRTYLAQDTELDCTVVVKLVLFGPDFTWADLRLFEREAETLKSLDHLAIPSYLDSFEVETPMGKGFALVQTYIDASSLQQQSNAGRTFSEQDLTEIAYQVLEILSYLHDRHPPVIHRDIKPSNLLVTNGSNGSIEKIYLIDFGSVQTTPSSGTMTIVGTYGYMPIEQFSGRALPASDLYSLGATLLFLATGKHPAELVQTNLQLDFSSHVKFTSEFTQWIEPLVQADLSRRTATAATALRSLAQIVPTERRRPEKRYIGKRRIEKRSIEKMPDKETSLKKISPEKVRRDAVGSTVPVPAYEAKQVGRNRVLEKTLARKRHVRDTSSWYQWLDDQELRKTRGITHSGALSLPSTFNDLEISSGPDMLSIQLLPFRLKESKETDWILSSLTFVAGWSLVLYMAFLINSALGFLLLFLILVFASIWNKEGDLIHSYHYKKASVHIYMPASETMQLSFSSFPLLSARDADARTKVAAVEAIKFPLKAIKSGVFDREICFIFEDSGPTDRKLTISGSRQEIQFLSKMISRKTCEPIQFWHRFFSAISNRWLQLEMTDEGKPYQRTSLPRLYYRRRP